MKYSEVFTKNKKKRKSSEKLLLITNNADEDDKARDLEQIKKRLLRFFKYHIGAENSATPKEIFKVALQIEDPSLIPFFERAFWWEQLRKVMRELRYMDEAFIISRGRRYFVLKTQEELKDYKEARDQTIKAHKNLKVMAEDWVRGQKWKKL
jgi:hypothetical protein